jgi:hypothetical protein
MTMAEQTQRTCSNVENPMYDFSTDLDGELNQRYRPSIQGQDPRVTSASITNAAFAPDGQPHCHEDASRPHGSRADAPCSISIQTSWILGVDELLEQQQQQLRSCPPAQNGVSSNTTHITLSPQQFPLPGLFCWR